MDDRTTQYGPFALIASTILCIASMIKTSQRGVSTYDTSADSIGNDTEHWPLDIANADDTVSRSDTIITSIILLVSVMPTMILLAFSAFCAAQELHVRTCPLPTWKIMIRPVLILLFSWAVWAAVKPEERFGRCALVILLLLIAWNMMKHGVRTYLRQLLGFVVRIVLLPVRVITSLSQHASHKTRGVEPADERPAQPPGQVSEEEQTTNNQHREIQRLLASMKDHEELSQLSRRTSAAEITRLQHELNRTKSYANNASSNAAAESTRLSGRYDILVASTREALDPNGTYHRGESIQYVVRRVKDHFASQRAELERRERALEGSSAMQAAHAAKKEAEGSMASLKDELKNQITTFGSEATMLRSALDAKDVDLEQLSAAKADADKSFQAEKAQLQKTLDDMSTALQQQIEDGETDLQKEATSKEVLEASVGEKDSQLASAEFQLAGLRRQVTALEDSEKVTKHKSAAKTQEFNNLQEAYKELASTQSEELTAFKCRADELASKLHQAEDDKNKLNAELRQKVDDLELKLSMAASASTIQADILAAEKQRLEDEHNAAMAAGETKARKTFEQAASEKEQLKKAHMAALAAKDHEIQALRDQAADMDVNGATETKSQLEMDQIKTLSSDLAAERTRARGLAERIDGLQQQQESTLVEGRAVIQGLGDELTRAKQEVEDLKKTIRSGNQQMEVMNNTVQSAYQKMEALDGMIQLKNQDLDKLKNDLLDADTEAECQKDYMEMAKEEKTKAQELSSNQQRHLNELQATIKTLRGELTKKEHALKVVGTDHSASEYQAVYADLERAKDLVDEISDVGCDEPARLVLEELAIANGTIVKVSIELKAMDDDFQDDKAWAGIHEELSGAIVGEHLLSSLSIANNTTESRHPVILKQAQKANERLRRLIKIVEEADAKARKNHVLAVMVLPRGDEGNDDEAQEPDSGSAGDADGATASKKRRGDDGVYSRPGGRSPSSTNKQTSGSSGSTSMKTASGEQPSTSTTASGFQLDPDHSFGKYSDRSPWA